MRLPFGLGRRSSSGDGAGSGDSDAGSGPAREAARASADVEGAGAADRGGVPSPGPRAWASLPAIQRTAGEMPLVAAPDRFVQRLPGSTGLPPIVQPLGHEVSSLATPGLVVARVRAVEAPAPGAIPAPVQRRATRASQAPDAEAAAFQSADEGAAAPVEPDAPGPPAPAASVAASHAPPPIRSMPSVSRLAIRMPERPLTSAAAAAQPAPVQRATPAAGPPGTPPRPRPAGGMRRVPSPASAAPVVSREPAHTHPRPTTAAASPPAPAAGGSTRRGLGDPILSAPATARPVTSPVPGPVVSRSTTSGPMPIAASNLRPAQRSGARIPDSTPAPGSGLAEPAVGRSGAAAVPELRLPHLPVQRSEEAPGAAPVAATAGARPAPPAPGSGREIRPTAAANPLRPALGIQRVASDGSDEPAADDELPSPWWSPAASATDPASIVATVPGLGGSAATSIPAQVQRSAAAGSSTAPAIATIAQHGAPGSRFARAVRSAPVAPPIQRSVRSSTPPVALPQPVGAGSRRGSGPAASILEPSVATASSTGRVIAGGPFVQTSLAGPAAPASPTAPAPSFGSAPSVQREEGSAPAVPASGGAGLPSERDLDELAQALFGRIRGRLRNDLIYDREAKGLTFDNV